MKTAKLIMLLVAYFTMPAGIFAQIGINTDNPQTLFHVDGRSTAATTNPGAGAPSPTQQSDDVIITSAGRVGVGTITPSVKMEINTQKIPGVYPIQVKDGGEAVGKILVSDAVGKAQWKAVLPPAGSVYPIQKVPAATLSGMNVALLVPGTDFIVPIDGFFSFEVRWWSEFTTVYTGSPQRVIIVFELRKNNTQVIDHFQYNTPFLNRAITTFIPLYSKASQGDKLSLYVTLVQGPGNIVTNASIDWTTSKVLVKKMLMND